MQNNSSSQIIYTTVSIGVNLCGRQLVEEASWLIQYRGVIPCMSCSCRPLSLSFVHMSWDWKLWALVSCPDPIMSRRWGSDDYWVIGLPNVMTQWWLTCSTSSLGTINQWSLLMRELSLGILYVHYLTVEGMSRCSLSVDMDTITWWACLPYMCVNW